jgi:hypothetical protein
LFIAGVEDNYSKSADLINEDGFGVITDGHFCQAFAGLEI